MINSVFARKLPRLALDFTTGVLDPRVTVARALNTATRINSSGLIEIVNADLPRFDHDPVTRAPKGLLVEETRTNLLLQSGFAGAVAGTPGTAPTSWALLNNTGSLAVADYQGIANALTFSVNLGREVIIQTCSVLANTTYTFSVKVLSASVQAQQMVLFNPAPSGTSVVGPYVNGVLRVGSYVPNADETLVYIISVAATAGSLTVRLGAGTSSNTTGAATLATPQLEAGNFKTSYIPTTTTSVIRNADVATITGTNFGGFWQAGKGSALVRARPNTVSGTRPLVQFDDTTANNIIALRGNATNPELYIRTAGSDQAQIDAGTIAADVRYRLAGAWATNDCAASLNSDSPVRDGVATIPVVTQARLGSDGTNYLNGHLEAIEYYDERALNASLQVLSSAAGYRSIIGPVFRDSIIS